MRFIFCGIYGESTLVIPSRYEKESVLPWDHEVRNSSELTNEEELQMKRENYVLIKNSESTVLPVLKDKLRHINNLKSLFEQKLI